MLINMVAVKELLHWRELVVHTLAKPIQPWKINACACCSFEVKEFTIFFPWTAECSLSALWAI